MITIYQALNMMKLLNPRLPQEIVVSLNPTLPLNHPVSASIILLLRIPASQHFQHSKQVKIKSRPWYRDPQVAR